MMNEAGRMERCFEMWTILKRCWESSARRNSTRKSFLEKETARKKSDEKRPTPSKKTILPLLKNKMEFDERKKESVSKEKFPSSKSHSRFLRMKRPFRQKIESCPVRIRVEF